MSGADTPVFTVVGGGLDEVELAALTAVLTACRSRSQVAGPAAPRSPGWHAHRFVGPRGWTSATSESRPGRVLPRQPRQLRGVR